MKIKEGYIMKSLAGGYVVVTVGEASKEFNGMIRMNATGAFIWNTILKGADSREKILSEMMNAYEDLDEATANKDLDVFTENAKMALED